MLYNNVCIEGIAHALPPHVVKSSDLETQLAPMFKRLGFPLGTLEKLTGVKERRWFDPGVKCAQPSALAGERVLEQTGIRASEIQMLVSGAVTRDYIEPATAAIVAGRLGLGPHCMNFDVTNACVGFMTAMLSVANMIELGAIDTGMVVVSEVVRGMVESTIARLQRDGVSADEFRGNFATLTLGSAGVAVILRAKHKSDSPHRLRGVVWHSDTERNNLCVATHSEMRSDGHGLLKYGVDCAVENWAKAESEFGWTPGGPDDIIAHQVGRTHFEHSFKRLGLSMDKALLTFPYLGNTGPVSVPVTLSVGVAQGRVRAGRELALFGVGSGLASVIMGVQW